MFYSTIPGKTPFTKLGSTPMFEVSIVNKLNCYLFSVPIYERCIKFPVPFVDTFFLSAVNSQVFTNFFCSDILQCFAWLRRFHENHRSVNTSILTYGTLKLVLYIANFIFVSIINFVTKGTTFFLSQYCIKLTVWSLYATKVKLKKLEQVAHG